MSMGPGSYLGRCETESSCAVYDKVTAAQAHKFEQGEIDGRQRLPVASFVMANFAGVRMR